MTAERKDRRQTLAEVLDATQWDFQPDADRKMLLRPVGTVFENLPWEIRTQYLGPAPVAEFEIEDGSGTETDDGVDTQPIERLKK